jgi:hypothetical protein
VLSGPFALAVEQACDAGASAAALKLEALEGVTLIELVRGELGPCATRQLALPGPFGDVARTSAAGEGVLSMLLERLGQTVEQDFSNDAWGGPDPFAPQRAAKRWHLSAERKLVGTPGLEAALKNLAAGTRMLVRCR